MSSAEEHVAASSPWWRAGFDPAATLSGAIASAAARWDKRPAVLLDDGSWITHGQVHERALPVAAWLAASRSAVACLTGTSASLYVALAAGVRSGVRLAVLDPAVPAARLRAAMAEVGADRVMVDATTLARGAELIADPRFRYNVDASVDEVVEATPNGMGTPRTPGPIYIFTSGSTGQPKGVIRSHTSLLHAAYNISKRCEYVPDDVMLYVGSPGHVGTLNDVLCSLLSGHATIPVGYGALEVSRLRGLIEQHRVTKLAVSPSLLRLMLRDLSEHGCRLPLRLVIPSGEPLLRSDVGLFFQVLGESVSLLQTYGSTEAGHTCAGWYHSKDSGGRGPLALTRVAEGVELDILNEQGDPVAVGESGAVRIRSAYLADGYTSDDQPDTKGRFGSDDRGRFYLTGDRARRVSEDGIVIEGRGDRQIKIHARRLELGDVESSILTCEGWAEASAIYLPSHGAGGMLAAMICPVRGGRGDIEALREQLSGKLEAFAIPRRFVVVDALPKTPTGKVDVPEITRRIEAALIDIDAPESDAKPRGLTENWIADAWQYVTRAAARPTRDIQFDTYGGDSLAAIALGLELSMRFGGDFSIDFVTQHMTVRGQAEAIDAMSGDPRLLSARVTRVVELRVSVVGPFCLLVPGIGGHAWVFLSLLRHLNAPCAVASLHLSASTATEAESLDPVTLTRHAAKAYTEARTEQPIVLMGYSFGCAIATAIAGRLIASGHPVKRVLLIDPAVAGRVTTLLRRTRARVEEAVRALRGSQTAPERTRRLDDEISLTTHALRRFYSPHRASLKGLTCDVAFSEQFFLETTSRTRVQGVCRDKLPVKVFDGLSHLDLMQERGAARVAAWVDDRLNVIPG